MLLSALLLLLACISPAQAINCYVSGGPEPGTLILVEYTEPGILCARYQYVCSKDDKSCTAKEVGRTKWSYIAFEKQLCDQLKSMPSVYKALTCCNSDKCNAPDPKLDKVVNVYPGMITATKEPAVTYRPEPAAAAKTAGLAAKKP